jgi:pimeloyl-ACP methyl ester carboxylesterase
VRWARTSVREPLGLSRKLAISYLQSGPGTPLRGFLAGLAHPTEHDVARIRVPLLLVRGEYDWICGPDWVSRLAAEATDVRMVVMPGAAHTVDYSAPAALAEITGPFLAGTG